MQNPKASGNFSKDLHGIRFGKFTIKSIPEAEINIHPVPLTLTSRTATKPCPLKEPETWKKMAVLGKQPSREHAF